MSIWVFNISKYNTIIYANGHYGILRDFMGISYACPAVIVR